MTRIFAHGGIAGFRAFGWQFDYRTNGAWLPFSIRYGHRKWHILRLGRLGMLTAGPVIKMKDVK